MPEPCPPQRRQAGGQAISEVRSGGQIRANRPASPYCDRQNKKRAAALRGPVREDSPPSPQARKRRRISARLAARGDVKLARFGRTFLLPTFVAARLRSPCRLLHLIEEDEHQHRFRRQGVEPTAPLPAVGAGVEMPIVLQCRWRRIDMTAGGPELPQGLHHVGRTGCCLQLVTRCKS